MGREVRMVPANWKHPKYTEGSAPFASAVGRHIPLLEGGGYAESAAEWDRAWAKWQSGLREAYGKDDKWVPVEPEYAHMRYTEYAGPRPSPDDYMPDWPANERTHFMMYEDTSEGTPISPAFATAEELARWLADTGASSFGSSTATYEQWLATINRGFAVSAVMSSDGYMMSGVEAMADDDR